MLEAISTVNFLALAQSDAPANLSGSWIFYLLLIVAVVGGMFLARLITNTLTVSEYAGRFAIVLVSVLVAGLIIFANWPPKFGVDLRGGINMIGSLNLEAYGGDGEVPTAAEIIPALMSRVNPSGTKEIMIRPLGDDKIEVTMPTVDRSEAQDIWERLVNTGTLEFRIVASKAEHPKEILLAETQATNPKTSLRNAREVQNVEGVTVAKWVRFARLYKDNLDRAQQKNAPFKYVPELRTSLIRSTNDGRIVNVPFNVTMDYETAGAELAKWAGEAGHRSLELLVIEPDDSQDVQGKYLSGIQQQPDEKGRNSVAFNLNAEGSLKMGMLTKLNLQKPMGIVLDGEIHSAPNIESAIYNRGTITGNFSTKEIQDLIINLKSGKLSVALNKSPISTDFIESTLGNELKQRGIIAIAGSLLLVLVFMIFYYRFAGIVASTALVLNLVLILALVMSIQYPFTLTGLAGLVLTVGMSVDANVLIFERIREETDRGAALRMAIRNGFEKATVTIFDANLTTLITAVVLYAMGTEQIKGFAVTLFLGIVISMYTAIFVSRLVFDIWERKRWLKELTMTRIMEKTKLSFLNKVGMTGMISVALILVGLLGVFLLGSKILDQDLRGGSTARLVFKEDTDIEFVREKLSALDVSYQGEDVEFEVASFGSDGGTAANRKFKVDSTLPAWEGESSGIEKFKELDEILSETFEGKLVLHHVDIDGVELTNEDPGDGGTETGRLQPIRPRAPTRPVWNGAPAVSVASLTGSMLTYQETNQETGESGESQSGEGESGENQTNDDQPADTTAGQDATGDQETDPDQAQPTEGEGIQAGGIQAGGVPESSIQEGAPEVPQEPTTQADVTVKRILTVTPEILGKSLKALLLEEATRMEMNLTEDSITVNTIDADDDESPESVTSSDWTVEMQVSNESDADEILRNWAATFNELPYFEASSQVGGQIAGETQVDALLAIFISLLGIVAYCWFRFQNLAFGLAAVIALIHDVLIVVGAIAISHWLAGIFGFLLIDEFKISLEVIAALLTVIGYSLNDTIVVFDRIREVRGKRTEITADMIDISISQTLSRTILTSVTTFIVVFILYLFGGDAIHGFAFALVIGVLVGTYSSIFVASPALLWLMNTVGLNPGEVDPEVAKA
ncbi:MAG: protein translocase subunit SecD [Planctomycetota bacterium]